MRQFPADQEFPERVFFVRHQEGTTSIYRSWVIAKICVEAGDEVWEATPTWTRMELNDEK